MERSDTNVKRSIALLGGFVCLAVAGAGLALADHGVSAQRSAATVALSVDSSASLVRVPEVAGQTIVFAEQAMTATGLKYAIKQSRARGPVGVVIAEPRLLERPFHPAPQ